MLPRRSFILASLGLFFAPHRALAKKRPVELNLAGPRTLSKEEWPPAIQPDFLAIADKGFALLSDQSGRLAIVNFKREEGPQVIGELTGIGKKIIDMTTTPHRAYALVYQESQGDAQYALVAISILPANDPTVLFKQPLSYFSEPTTLAAANDVVAVAGVGLNGENQVVLLNTNTKHRSDDGNSALATLAFETPVTRLDLQDRQLVALQASARNTQLDVFNLNNIRSPERAASIKLDGNYPVLSRQHDVLAVAGQTFDRKYDLKLISMRPAMHVVSHVSLALTEVLDIGAQKGQLLVLGNQINRQVVIPVSINSKDWSLSAASPVMLPVGTRGAASKARIAVSGKDAYVASDWGGVQVLNINKAGWQYLYSHTIPRLPAAAIAVQGNRAVVAGADLKVYDIDELHHPSVLSTTELGSAVRCVRTFSRYILALTRENLSLRELEKPSSAVASLNLSGQSLAYDHSIHRAFVLSAKDKTTNIYPIAVNGGLKQETPLEVDGIFSHASAGAGNLLLSGLNNIALYRIGDSAQVVATRLFPNLAIRDAALAGNRVVLTALDPNSRGFLLVLDVSGTELTTIGSIDLPQDGVALAVSGTSAVVVGRASAGKDVASIINLTNPAAPKVVDSFPVLEAASAVAIRDSIALVAGRGLEILSLA